MVLTIIGLVLFLILVLAAVRIGLNREGAQEEQSSNPLIYASGVYSIVRRSPREELLKIRPSIENIRKYISSQNESFKGTLLSTGEIEKFIERWSETVNHNIQTVEQGDKDGVEFYFYDFDPVTCSVCQNYLNKGNFVTREEIFHYPQVLPPFHVGCTCCIKPHYGKESLKDTTELGMRPLFRSQTPPPLPDWTIISKQLVL